MNKEIQKYLNKGYPRYDEGLALLQKYAPQQLDFFRGKTALSGRAFLLKELQQLSKAVKDIETVSGKILKVTQAKQKQAVQSFKKIPLPTPKTDKPKELQEVIAYKDERYHELQRLRNSLLQCANDEKRAEQVDRILALYEENTKLWKQVDYYEIHGHFIDHKSPLEKKKESSGENLLELQKKLVNRVRPRCTRKKASLEAISAKWGEEHPRFLKAAEEYEKMLREKEELEMMLKIPS
ncbi:hypothetical protein [Flammeovirga aprica]|uniref:Uncharacterized protein n=1 Tax=Flammeovirga aprica JL-4 TaxID=694437 RepID=A0A7X9P0S0_9BACT|nr:hypothetical protein [Flammeovirga aprica]NME67205.1 hypothetical protein [Flammeovirga aprica JL-4]